MNKAEEITPQGGDALLGMPEFVPSPPVQADTRVDAAAAVALSKVRPFGIDMMKRWDDNLRVSSKSDEISTASTSPVWNPHTKTHTNLVDDR